MYAKTYQQQCTDCNYKVTILQLHVRLCSILTLPALHSVLATLSMLFVESKRLCQIYDSFAWLDRVGLTLHPVSHTHQRTAD